MRSSAFKTATTDEGPLSLASVPLWRRYIDSLPNGMSSHPQCVVKGSVVRGLLDSPPSELDTLLLPPEVAEIVEHPPLPNAWVSEVLFHLMMHALQDGLTDAASDRWVYERNRKLLSTSLYRILFLVVSPERLFVGAAHRWSAFRRGTDLSVIERNNTTARLALRFPSRLHSALTVRNMSIALRGAADAAGAKETSASVVDFTDVGAEILIGWR